MLCSLPGDDQYAVDREMERERNRVMKGQIEEELRQLEDEISACKRMCAHTHTHRYSMPSQHRHLSMLIVGSFDSHHAVFFCTTGSGTVKEINGCVCSLLQYRL